MRKLFTLIFIVFLLIPVSTYAANQTANVTAAASKVEASPTNLGIYPFAALDTENPWDNLCRVTITFRDLQSSSVYQHSGDTVNFFIKSTRDAEMGWVDRNANGDYETGELLDTQAMGTPNGSYVTEAKLTRSGTVTFYVGSRIPGSFDIKVYTDNNGKPGNLIGIALPKVAMGENTIRLTAYNEKGTSTLSGNSGYSQNPFELIAGEGVVFKASVRVGNTPQKDKTVTLKKSFGLGLYTVIGTDVTDEDGIAVIEYEAKEAGLYSYQAFVDEVASEEIFVNYSPAKVESVKAKTIDGKLLVHKEEYEIEFYVKDEYGNPVDSKGIDNVEFAVVNTPKDSVFDDYRSIGRSNKDGIAVLKFKPDKIGTYSIRCKLLGTRGSDTIDVESVDFGEAKSMQFTLKKGQNMIPAVKYTDANDDGIPEDGGYLEVKLINNLGVEITAKRYSMNTLSFSSSNNEIIEIDYDGDITVKDKDFTGSIPITVMDNNSKVIGVYNLKIAGAPVSIKPRAQTTGRKAIVTLQYIDKSGNDTYSTPGEEYSISLPVTGIASWDIKPFDSMGKATFILNADEFNTYNLSATTKLSNITKKFQVEYRLPTVKQVIGAKNVIMFIGTKSYSQDGTTKVTDVAPFIKDGRTFVAVRPVADAFGAAVDWNEDVRTVTLTRSDMTVTIIIGSKTITIVQGGVSSTVIADVPAMISEGRTVLPFRAVGDAFGANVSYDPATKSVSYMQ